MNHRNTEQLFTWYVYILLLSSVSIPQVYASLIIVLVGCEVKQMIEKGSERKKKKSLMARKKTPRVSQTNEIHCAIKWQNISVNKKLSVIFNKHIAT